MWLKIKVHANNLFYIFARLGMYLQLCFVSILPPSSSTPGVFFLLYQVFSGSLGFITSNDILSLQIVFISSLYTGTTIALAVSPSLSVAVLSWQSFTANWEIKIKWNNLRCQETIIRGGRVMSRNVMQTIMIIQLNDYCF